MISAKEFFEGLFDGEEYAIIMMRSDYYHELDEHFKNESTLIVKEYNEDFKDDATHLKLSKDVSKARKILRNYEFEINNK